MGAPVRFLFDNDFTTPPPEVVAVPEEELEEEVPKVELEIHLQELKNAEAAAYQRGFVEGQQNAQAEVHEQLTLKTQRMSEAADKMIALIDGDLKRIEADAMVLTATIAKKIAGFALSHYSDDQIMGLIAECLAPLRNVRHLAIRVNEAFVDRLKEPIESLAAKNGFEGRLLILGEPETKPGDCRIEWADGGILFERSEVVASVDAAIIDYLGDATIDYETGLEIPADAESVPDDPEPDEGDSDDAAGMEFPVGDETFQDGLHPTSQDANPFEPVPSSEPPPPSEPELSPDPVLSAQNNPVSETEHAGLRDGASSDATPAGVGNQDAAHSDAAPESADPQNTGPRITEPMIAGPMEDER